MNVKAAIWSIHPGDLLGEAITFETHGPAQHAGFIRGNGLIHELYLPSPRDRNIVHAEWPYLMTFDIEGLTDDLSAKLERHFDDVLASDAIHYSIEELFRIKFNLPPPPGGWLVCSQYVFWHLKMIGLPPLVRCARDFITPRDLLISPRLVGPLEG
jgi:hypothetical protein